MQKTLLFFPIVCVAAGGFALLLAGCSKPPPTEPPEESKGSAPVQQKAAEDWREKREQLREQAAMIARERAADQVEPKQVAKEAGLPWPASTPENPKHVVREKVEKRLEERVEEKYPLEQLDVIRKEIADKYPVKEPGDHVKFVIRGGVGRGAVVEGTFRDVTRDYIHVSGRKVLKSDMKKQDLAMFDKEVREELIEKQFRLKSYVFREDREEYRNTIKQEVFVEGFREAGYIYWDREFVPANELLARLVAERIDEKAEQIRPEIEQQLFKEAGFTLKEGEWRPTAVSKTVDFLKKSLD